MKTRYLVSWIKRQHFDELGEWIPDRDEYEHREYQTLRAAEEHAAQQARLAGIADWYRIEEQTQVPYRDCRGKFYRWETLRRWTGDSEGMDQSR